MISDIAKKLLMRYGLRRIGIGSETYYIDEANKAAYIWISTGPWPPREYVKKEATRILRINDGYIALKEVGYEDVMRMFEEHLEPVKQVLMPREAEELVVRVLLREKLADVISSLRRYMKRGRYKRAERIVLEAIKDVREMIGDIEYMPHGSKEYNVEYWEELSEGSDNQPCIMFKEIFDVWQVRIPEWYYANEVWVLRTDIGYVCIRVVGYPEGYTVDIYILKDHKIYYVKPILEREYSEEVGLILRRTRCELVPLKLVELEPGYRYVHRIIEEELRKVEREGKE